MGQRGNPSCQRSSTTERGVKVAPTFSTTDWVRRRCRQKRTAKTSRDSPIRLAAPSLEKSRLMVYGTLVCQVSSYRPAIGSSDFLNETHRKHGSPIEVPRTRLAFHPLAQRNAFCHRDVRQQSQIVRPLESKAELWFRPSSGRIHPSVLSVRSVVKLFLLFLAEFLESGIGAQGVPDRIEP